MVELVFPRRTRMQHLFRTHVTLTVERLFPRATPPAAADTVYNLGYWNNTSGDLVTGVVVRVGRECCH